MSSPAEQSSTAATPEGAAPAPVGAATAAENGTHAAAPATGPHASPDAADGPSGEVGMWAAVDAVPRDFDELVAEKEASKVFALWEIAPSLAEPAAATAQTAAAEKEAPDVWGVAPATEKMDAPPAPVIAMAPLSVTSSAQVTGEYGASDALRLPEAKGTRNVMFAAVALVGLMVIGGGVAMFSSGGSAAAPIAAPPIGAAPVVAEAPVAPAAVAPAAVAPAAGGPATVAPAAVAPAAVAPEAVPPAAVAAAPVVAQPVVAEPAIVESPRTAVQVAAAVPPAVIAQPTPPPPLHRLRVRTVPAGATLTLDGAPIANPYDGRLPEGSSHDIVATAPDHLPHTESFTIGRRDQELTLRPQRIPAPAPPPVAAAPATRPPPAARTTEPARTAERRRPAASVRPRAGRGASSSGASSSGASSSGGAGFVTESPY